MAYTTIDKPTDYFNTKLYTGNGGTQSITGVGFQPDWTWIKERDDTPDHKLIDSVRGVTKTLESNNSDAEGTLTTGITSFDSDGFSLGANGSTNGSSDLFVSWNWLAGGTAPAITYTVKVVSDSGNKYRFDDFGTSAVTLDLQEGGTYTFDQSDSSNSGHPLRFSTTSNGTHGGGSEYTTGVTVTGTPGNAGAKTVITVAASAPTLYYYCTNHSLMGGQANTNSLFGSSNFSGSIQSTVSAGTTQGFSVVSYTGTGSNTTVGHGLSQEPDLMIFKNRDGADDWSVYHQSLGNTNYLLLNTNGASSSSSSRFNNTSPTSSVFTISTSGDVNNSSDKYIAYCFAEKKGFSKFGSYTGNGSTDGAFVYTGFRPAFLAIKGTGSNQEFPIFDSAREPTNDGTLKSVWTNLYNSESSGYALDFLSNGFKVRNTGSTLGSSGQLYTYICFAESPFVNSSGVPTNAR